MRNERMRGWLWLVLGLAACSSEEPQGDGSDTTTASTDPTETADTTDGTGDCGNGAIDEGEQCDGSELGGATCPDVNPGYAGGTLACGASCTFDASACELAPGASLVVLNEVTSEAVLAGDFAGPNDAIELYNAGSTTADLSGWRISDDPTLPAAGTYALPDGTALEPGEFLVLRSIDDVTGTGELPFGISDSSLEVIVLADADGTPLDLVTVDGYLARVSYCRVPDGTGAWLQCEQTFGAANLAADSACGDGVAEDAEPCDGRDVPAGSCEALDLGFSGGTLACTPTCALDTDACTTDSLVVLNELSAESEAIEIFNGGDTEVDLSGWVLTDERVGPDYDVAADLEALVFAPDTVLGPGEYRVVFQGLAPNQHPFGLASSGDRVTLADPSPLTIIDLVTYEAGQADLSWCRQPNGPGGAWESCAATIGGAN